MPRDREGRLHRASSAARDRAWRLDRALAEARDRARALTFAVALRLGPGLTLELEVDDVLGELVRELRAPLVFDVSFVLDLDRGQDVERIVELDIAREVDRIRGLDRALGLVADVTRAYPRPVARTRAALLERTLRRARSRSRELELALRRVQAEFALSRTAAMPAEASVLTSMALLLPPDQRARFIEEQAASLAWSQGRERTCFLAGLVIGIPRYALLVRRTQRGRPGARVDNGHEP